MHALLIHICFVLVIIFFSLRIFLHISVSLTFQCHPHHSWLISTFVCLTPSQLSLIPVNPLLMSTHPSHSSHMFTSSYSSPSPSNSTCLHPILIPSPILSSTELNCLTQSHSPHPSLHSLALPSHHLLLGWQSSLTLSPGRKMGRRKVVVKVTIKVWATLARDALCCLALQYGDAKGSFRNYRSTC